MVPLKRDNIVFYLNQSVYAYAGWTHGGLKNRIKAKKKKKKRKKETSIDISCQTWRGGGGGECVHSWLGNARAKPFNLYPNVIFGKVNGRD
jgi:uncharacterized protein YidB (DUF937 family)